MREIKFRAWDKEKKIMIDDTDQNVQKNYPVLPGDWIHDTVWRIGKLNGTLMQFTGLLDKNGKEIYEGDIVESSNDGKDGCDVWNSAFAVVNITVKDGITFQELEKGRYLWDWENEESMYTLKYCEIVGNIYKNP